MPAAVLNLPERVLISGAAGGIGGALASKLSEAGADVIGTDLRATPGQWNGVDWIEADISTEAGRSAIVAGAGEGIGGVVFAAGILDPANWEQIDDAAAAHLFSVNVLAPFFLTRALLPALSGDSSVVILGSIAGERGSPATPIYAASKAGLRNLAASLALLLQPGGIRVNVVAPGLIDTPLTSALNRELAAGRSLSIAQIEAERTAAIPLGRAGTPAEVADACLYLLSRQSAYLTGSTIFPAGGVLAGIT